MSDRTSATGSSYQREAADGGDFAGLAPARCMLLTTFKPDGIPHSAAVHGIVDEDRAYFRAWSHSGTARNLRHTSEVQVTPCAMRGLVTLGPPLDAVARLLPGEEASQVAAKLARKYPVQRYLIPLLRRVRRGQMAYYQLVPYEAATAETNDHGTAGNLRSKEPRPYRITVTRSSAPFPWP